MQTKKPKVFISYSHDSKRHAERVLALASRLRKYGIDCNIDQYEPHPPQGWQRWMEQQLEDADFVLIVATRAYFEHASGLSQVGAGRGVTFEIQLLVQELYDSRMWTERFIPVLFSDAQEADIIRPLRPYTRYRVDTPEGFEALYRRLTHQPEIIKPQLGDIKELPPRNGIGDDFEERLTPALPPTGPLPAGDNINEPRSTWPRPLLLAATIVLTVVGLAGGGRYLRDSWNEPVDTPEPVVNRLQILEGEIREAGTRLPLAGVKVVLPKYDKVATTNALGRYRFDLDVPQYTRVALRATLAGYAPIEQDPVVGGDDSWQMRRLE